MKALLVGLEAAPVEVQDHVHDAGVVADDVKVPVVDQGSVVFQTELNVLPAVVHEHIDHGEVDVARVGELEAAHVQRLARGSSLSSLSSPLSSPGGWTPGCRSPRSCLQPGQSHTENKKNLSWLSILSFLSEQDKKLSL